MTARRFDALGLSVMSNAVAMIAEEIGADVNVCRRGALLHDLGKAIDHEVEGPHALIGAELAKRLKESPAVCHAIEAHHGEADEAEVQRAARGVEDEFPQGSEL